MRNAPTPPIHLVEREGEQKVSSSVSITFGRTPKKKSNTELKNLHLSENEIHPDYVAADQKKKESWEGETHPTRM